MSKLVKSLQNILNHYVNSNGFDRVLEKVRLFELNYSPNYCIFFSSNQVVITNAEKGKIFAEMEVCEEHVNRGGHLHGGLTATIVDKLSTMSLEACGEENLEKVEIPVNPSLELNISYIGPAKIGDTIIIEASVLKQGKSIAFLNVDIFNKSNNKLIARGNHIKFMAKK